MEKPIVQIKDLFGHIVLESKRTRRTEKGDLLNFFLERINADRDGVKYKKLDIKRMGFLLSVYNVEQLYFLRMKCEKATNFSKTFWWYVNNKPEVSHFNK